MKKSYVAQMKKHLEAYKRDRMGLDIPGTWIKNGKPYSHLLEKVSHRLNILEPYRTEFWVARQEGDLGKFELHPCFHHLTSSQAMCFNLFFPFLHGNRKYLPILLKSLGLPTEEVAEAVFEKILDEKESTAFDFFLRYKDGSQITFEVKFTEGDFGATTVDAKHERKFKEIYFPMTEGILTPEYREMKAFLKHYQFLRNLIYLGTAEKSHCLFILPKANPAFAGVEKRLDSALLSEFRQKARAVWLEDVVATLSSSVSTTGDSRLIHHIDAFGEKYLPLSWHAKFCSN